MTETTTKLNLKDFITRWNVHYPYDRYIRKKYNIMFGSPQHRALSFVDMAIEFKEDLILSDQEEAKVSAELERDLGVNTQNQPVKPKAVKVSKQQLAMDFENIDLSQFDDNVKTPVTNGKDNK